MEQYQNKVKELFSEYLSDLISLNDMVYQLYKIEVREWLKTKNEAIDSTGIWFKFSKDDTLSTTIADLKKDLEGKNKEFTIERIKEVVNNNQELKIFYS